MVMIREVSMSLKVCGRSGTTVTVSSYGNNPGEVTEQASKSRSCAQSIAWNDTPVSTVESANNPGRFYSAYALLDEVDPLNPDMA